MSHLLQHFIGHWRIAYKFVFLSRYVSSDWEPYHPRAQHHHGAAGMAPMGSIGSGARAERSGMRGHSGSNAGGGVGDDFGETGYGSSAVGLSGGMRGEKGGR